MRLYTSRWANKSLAELECAPVGISRGVPRFSTGYKYRLVRELAPGDAAWNAPDWESFQAAYVRQLEELGTEAILDRLERIGDGLPVVMLCYEQDPCDCHRNTLSSWLRERGVEIEELAPGMLPERDGVPQPRLF